MKKISMLMLLGLALGVSSAWASTGTTDPGSFQDTVGWCQFGCPNSTLTTPQAWISAMGNTGLAGNTSTQNINILQQGVTWSGNFADGMGVLYNGVETLGNSPTAIGVTFDQAVFGVGAYIQGDLFGAFTGTITLLDANLDPIFSFSADGTSDQNVGTALFIGAYDTTADVWGAIFSTNDNDFGIGDMLLQTSPNAPPPVPEPGTLLLVAPSLLGLAGMLRNRMARKSQEVM